MTDPQAGWGASTFGSFDVAVDPRSPIPSPPIAPSSTQPGRKSKSGQSHVETHYRTQALQALAALGYHGISAADFHRLYPADEYEEELKVMAGVRAHFQVACKVRYDNPSFSCLHVPCPDRIILPLPENHRPSSPRNRA